ncbi:unnamed protein product [Cylicocyclus nassatus]|uniref:Nudix hydrolase domain-containing protein n=1 Tax=Cylicocyclus nassatus TaxID=53992 RepID=A0AA36GM03_CYLNA|nr:unnamed protein product [Cylicocyclus nassatus]
MLLPAKTTVDGSMLVQTRKLPKDLKTMQFEEMLFDSLEAWKRLDVEIVRITVELEDSFLIPILAKYGFKFSSLTAENVTMSKWLPLYAQSPLASLGCNYHSVACMVLDNLGRILMVKEQKRISLGWKFPGGKASGCEGIFETARRKVLEETGVRAIPDAIISLRHKAALPYSNIGTFFFGCLMHSKDGHEERDPPFYPEGYLVSWFTRRELRGLGEEDFFHHHRDLFLEYDKWLSANADQPFVTSDHGWHISPLFMFSTV